ncbi:MAG: SpoIIE family protein phosphatase [Clostridia bacterium]|nr:SpoIIE family protein phosphatase [Clostridia bacterium]
MNNLKDREEQAADSKGGIGEKYSRMVKGALSGAALGEKSILYYTVVFTLALLFGRCHTVFSAHPLGIAMTALMPEQVFVTAAGCVLGSLTVGRSGIIYALAVSLTLFLRALISGGRRTEHLFKDGLGVRMSCAVVGGSVVALYEVLLGGLSAATVLLGATMVLMPPAAVFLLSGLFENGLSLSEVFSANKNLLSLAGRSDKERFNLIFFQLSCLTLLFLVTLSLSEIELMGISAPYIFVGFVTILVAKRFGAIRAMAVGFVSALSISGVYSVSFALAGLGAGLLFGFGATYALIAGGALLSMWSAYSGGLEGFLSTLPEYMISAILAGPVCKDIVKEKTAEGIASVERTAKDMVGTAALKYKGRTTDAIHGLEASLSEMAMLVREYSKAHFPLSQEDYRDIVIDVAERNCRSCPEQKMCMAEDIRPVFRGADKIAGKLAEGKAITAEDVNGSTEFCQKAESVAEEIMREAARAEREDRRLKDTDSTADVYELVAKLISDARGYDVSESVSADEYTEPLTNMMRELGYDDAVIRVFGERKKHFIVALEDEDGDRISSKDLQLGIERIASVRLGTPEFYRGGKMALMECDARRAFSVECASGRISADEKEICGDTVSVFESASDTFYALISDGMGRGELAGDTSAFVAGFLERALSCVAEKETVLHLLNHVMRGRSEECSATVDLFELDLITGDATFVKSGSAPSFIKRDKSIFRIKSQTAPIGLMRSIDSEKIRVEVKSEDYVIMISDGILQSAEESPWLVELLASPAPKTLKEYVDLILSEATRRSDSGDDMSVIVMKIQKI